MTLRNVKVFLTEMNPLRIIINSADRAFHPLLAHCLVFSSPQFSSHQPCFQQQAAVCSDKALTAHYLTPN